MLWIVLAMLAILVLAVIVGLYVAFPYRGYQVPKAPWIGDTMLKGVERLPTLDNTTDQRH